MLSATSKSHVVCCSGGKNAITERYSIFGLIMAPLSQLCQKYTESGLWNQKADKTSSEMGAIFVKSWVVTAGKGKNQNVSPARADRSKVIEAIF